MVKKRRSAAWGGDDAPDIGESAAIIPRKKKVAKKAVAKKPVEGKKGKKKTKKQAHDEAHTGERLGQTTSMYLTELVDRTRRETGDLTVATLEDAGGLVIGIPCPSLAFEYMICNSVIPLEKVMQIYGPRGIGKSGLAFEMMRWFRKYHGIGQLLEHETKFNPDWASSIIGWDDLDCMGVIPCDNIEDWETHLQRGVSHVKRIMTGDSKTLGSGRIFPFLSIVDSIMGKTTRETQDKIAESGYAGRSHPIEAMSITRFVQAFSSQLRRWPFMLICINHLKISGSEGGRAKETRSGGQTIDFQGSFELKVKRVGRIRSAKVDGNKLTIQADKNSFGEDKRKIPVNVIWWDEDWQDPANGEIITRQQTRFDWHGATVELILSNVEQKQGAIWTEAKEITGLVRDSATRAHSKLLGVPNKDKNVEYHVLGQRIANNPQMVAGLRKIFRVRERKVFTNEIDYQDQLKLLKRQVAVK